jgi:polyisoprenoid-binding protein YceI
MVWQFDPNHTQVEFAVKHFGMMTVRGRFNDVAVNGTVDPDHPEHTSLNVTIDVASLSTNNAQRDNDLRSSNFLDLEAYPTITFHSTGAEQNGPDRYALTGVLTIKGNNRPVTLQVQRYGEINDPMMGHRVGYSAEGTINRKDFGMSFDMLADGRLVVGHDVKIFIEGELMEQPAGEPAAQPAGQTAAPSA